MSEEQKTPLLWNYRLANDVFFPADNIMAKSSPLRLFRLSGLAKQLITQLAEGSFSSTRPPVQTEQFAEYLATQGVLVRSVNGAVDDELPTISVVITVRNRPQEIDLCLQSLAGADYPAEKMEVIVVDGSTDGETTAVIRQHNVKLLKMAEDPGLSACRNAGVRMAGGEIIAFTDSDCEVSTGWLMTLAGSFRDPETAFVGGGVLTKKLYNIIDRYEAVRSPLFMGNSIEVVDKQGAVPYVPTCNLLIRRDVFNRLGGFREHLRVGEDVDLIWRALAEGYKGWYVPDGHVWHHHRNKIFPFLRRRAQYAASEASLQQLGHTIKKYLNMPRWHLPLLVAIFASLYLRSFLLIAAVLPLMLLIELASKRSRLKKKGLHIGLGVLCRSVFSSFRSTLKYFSALLTRYYLWLLLLVAGLTWTLGGWILLAIPLLSLLIEYPYRSRLPFTIFSPLYILEMLYYSIGFWLGCFKSGQFNLLLLKVYLR